MNYTDPAYLHALSPYAVNFGAFGIRWYGLAYLGGFFAAYLLTLWLAKRGRCLLKPDQVGDFMFWIALGTIGGARLGYCLFYAPSLLISITPDFPFWQALALHKGGMSSHGGMLGVIVAAWAYARKYKLPLPHLLDLTILGGTLGIFFGRVANFVNGELPGRAAPPGFKWAVKFPQDILSWPEFAPAKLPGLESVVSHLGVTAGQWQELVKQGGLAAARVDALLYRIVEAVQQGNGAVAEALRPLLAARYPSQIYEALLEGLFLFCILGLVWLKPQKPGTIAGIFLSLYALVRIIGEQFRQPDLQLGFQLFGLTRGQWLSLCALLVGIVSTVFWIKRNVQRINGFNDLPSVIFLAPLAAVLILLAMIMPRPVLSSAATDLAGIPAHLLNIDADKVDWKSKDEAYWQSVLTADQFTICREAQTERPFSGKYCASKAQGEYRCACCGQLLFSSKTKFDSGSGWPSFGEAALPGAIVERPDLSHNMSRTEVLCSRCGAHLGHVFDDGPPPTHKRYCINSVCLYLQP